MTTGEAWYRSLIECGASVCTVVDADGRTLYQSPSIERAYGWKSEDLVGRSFFDLVHPEDLAHARRSFAGLVAEPGLVTTAELRVRHKDGSWRTIELTGKNLLNDPDVRGVVLTSGDITRHKRTEEELGESLDRFSAFVRDSAYAYVEMDLEGNLTSANARAAELSGYSVEELVGMNMSQLVAADDLARTYADLKLVLTEPNAGPREYRLLRKDGDAFFGMVNTLPLMRAGRPVGFQVTLDDVTAHRRAEEALRESEERYRLVAETAREIMVIHDLDGRILYANRATAELLGYDLGEIVGTRTLDLVAPEYREFVTERYRLRAAGEYDRSLHELEVVTRDGRRIPLEVSSAMFLQEGRPTRILIVARDITERRRAEDALSKSEEKYRLLAENASDVIWTMGLDLRYTYVSPSVARQRGFSAEEMMRQGIDDVMSPESVAMVRKFAAGEFAAHPGAPDLPVTVELEVRHKDGHLVPVETNVRFLRGPDGRPVGLLGITRDITGRRRAVEALRESEELHRTLMEALPDAVTVTNLDGRVTYASPAAVRAYRSDGADDILGMTAFDLIAPEDRERALVNMRKTLETGILRSAEYSLLRQDGTSYPGELSAAVVPDASGRPKAFVAITRDLTERRRAEKALEEVTALRTEMQGLYGLGSIIGRGPKMRAVYETVLAVGRTNATVLVQGETGTGKELIAKAIHYNSTRREGPFVKVDCGALAENLLESELFGHVKGAFTGAVSDRAGRFEMASDGTVFLDEIHNLSMRLQGKLLRVVQDGCFEKVGDTKTREANARIVAATNEDLADLVASGAFRKDLFYRVNVVPIEIPPLRERREDIPLLAGSFVRRFAQRHEKQARYVEGEALDKLMRYDWPGNVRELENIIEQAVVFSRGQTIRAEEIRLPEGYAGAEPAPPPAAGPGSLRTAVEECEKRTIRAALDGAGGNRAKAAALLGISRSVLYVKLRELGLSKRR